MSVCVIKKKKLEGANLSVDWMVQYLLGAFQVHSRSTGRALHLMELLWLATKALCLMDAQWARCEGLLLKGEPQTRSKGPMPNSGTKTICHKSPPLDSGLQLRNKGPPVEGAILDFRLMGTFQTSNKGLM